SPFRGYPKAWPFGSGFLLYRNFKVSLEKRVTAACREHVERILLLSPEPVEGITLMINLSNLKLDERELPIGNRKLN
ncbi:hypothetical protein ACFL27_20900, partial [candidate division CSSED10-310 bacterium]